MGKIKKYKGGSFGVAVDDVGQVEMRFQRLTTSQRVGLAALMGRAAEEVTRHWLTFAQIDAAETQAQDEQQREAALLRIHELHEIFQPATWEQVADVLIEYCTELRVDGELVEDEEEIDEILRLLPAYDAEAALKRLYKAQDALSEAEGKRSESTSTT